MRRPLAGLLPVSLLLAVGCATPQLGTAPSSGGFAWHQLESAHFRVRTDLDLPHARERVAELERFRAAILLGLSAPEPPGQLEVILFRDFAELAEFHAGGVFGFLSRSDLGALLVCSEETFPDETWGRGSARAHELAHDLSAFSIIRQPRWFAEGLAGYFGTTQFDGAGHVALGVPSRMMLGVLNAAGRPLSLPVLWDWSSRPHGSVGQDAETHAYASSWIWFHTLSRFHPRELTDFERRLALAQDPRAAFSAAFAAFDEATLEREVLANHLEAQILPLPAIPTVLSERELTDAEFHLARARVYLAIQSNTEANRAAALGELSEAIHADPRDLPARLLALRLWPSSPRRLALARALVRERPDSGEAWLVLGATLAETGEVSAERDDAFQRALLLAPQSGQVLSDVAWEYAGEGRAAQALPLIQRAVALEPWHPSRLDTYAFVLNALGRCADAVDQEQRALDLLPDMDGQTVEQDFAARMAVYRRACELPSPPTLAHPDPDDDGPARLRSSSK